MTAAAGEGLRELASASVEWMRRRDPAAQSEIYLSRSRWRTLARRQGALDSRENSESSGAGVRVVRDGRAGFASGPAGDEEAVRRLWELAAAQLAELEPEEGRALPKAAAAPPDAAFAASLWDEKLFARSWDELEAKLGDAEAGAGGGKAKAIRSELTESGGETVVASTAGLLARERGGSFSLAVTAAAGSGGELQVAEGDRSSRRFDALDAGGAGMEAARRAECGLDAGRARAGRRAVLFEPWIGAEFLELLSDLLSAAEVQGRRSLLAGRLGERVGSPLVTLRDEPRRPGGPASCFFDDEGVPTFDKGMIEAGVLKDYLYDGFTAAKDGRASNGCGYRDGWRGLPGPGSSNLILAPGKLSRRDLIGDTKDGLLVMEVLGLHMADPVSGEFSVGISGMAIEKGAQTKPFKGAMASGNILDLLGRVDAVASDLFFHGAAAAPTFRVSALDVA